RAAATAARSVTRTSSRVRIRSRPEWARPDGAALDMVSNLAKDQWVASRDCGSFVKEVPRPQGRFAARPKINRLNDGWMTSRRTLDADDLRLGRQVAVLGDAVHRLAHGGLGGLVGDEDDGLLARAVGAVGVLDDGFERDAVLGHAAGDGREHAGPVVDGEPDEIAALVGAHRRALVRRELARRASENRAVLEAGPALGDIGDIADHGGRG